MQPKWARERAMPPAVRRTPVKSKTKEKTSEEDYAMACGHHLLNGSLFRVCLDSLFSAPVVTSICIPETSLTLCHAVMIECSLNHF